MRLQKKLTILSTLVIAMVGTCVGIAVILNNYANQIARIDQRLNADASIILKSPSNKLSTALLIGGQTDIPLTVAYVSETRALTVLVESKLALHKSPSEKILKTSGNTVITGLTKVPSRARIVPIGNGEYLIFLASTESAAEIRSEQFRWLVILILISLLVGALAMNRLIRADIKSIEQLASLAKEVAAGNHSQSVLIRSGSTEIKDLSDAIQQMVKNLVSAYSAQKQSNESMQQFLGDASHELRTPITTIRGYAEILGNSIEEPNPQQQRAISRIQTEFSRLGELIDDLLLLAQLGESRSLNIAKVEFSELVSEQIADLAVLQPMRQIRSDIEADLLCPGDEKLLFRMLSNLFSNIRQHTGETDSISVQLHKEGPKLVLTIKDSGPGMPDKFYNSMTNSPFERFDSSRSRSTGGAGLGLSIIEAIVIAHSGEMKISRSDLGGHQTLIELPVT